MKIKKIYYLVVFYTFEWKSFIAINYSKLVRSNTKTEFICIIQCHAYSPSFKLISLM